MRETAQCSGERRGVSPTWLRPDELPRRAYASTLAFISNVAVRSRLANRCTAACPMAAHTTLGHRDIAPASVSRRTTSLLRLRRCRCQRRLRRFCRRCLLQPGRELFVRKRHHPVEHAPLLNNSHRSNLPTTREQLNFDFTSLPLAISTSHRRTRPSRPCRASGSSAAW